MRIAVIGAGIVGVHVGVELARHGAEVTLIDRGRPGGETTSGSFAWIDSSHPGIAPYLELRVLGVKAWQRREQELGRPSWLSLTGTLIWVRDPREAERFEEHARRLESRGCRPTRLTVSAALREGPALRVPSDVATVYRFDGEGWVQTGPAIAALLERGRAAGLHLRTASEVRELSTDGPGRVNGLTFASGERLDTDAVVSCAGRFTEELLDPAGVRVPMLGPASTEAHVAGLVAQTSPVRSGIDTVIFADGLLIRPEPGGRLLLHSDARDAELSGETPPPRAGGKLLEMLTDRLRGTDGARVENARVCVRAVPGDLRPVVGWALEGLYVVATHSGVTLAPALGELVAAELIEGRTRQELERFRPGRFRSVVA